MESPTNESAPGLASEARLSLPLYLVTHHGFQVKPYLGSGQVELRAENGAALGRLACSRERERLLGLLPVDRTWDVRLELAGEEARGPRARWKPRVGPSFPELELLDEAGAAQGGIDGWTGFAGTLRDGAGVEIGRLENADPLGFSVRLRPRPRPRSDSNSASSVETGGALLVERLGWKERRSLPFKPAHFREVFALRCEDASRGAAAVDARLLLAWCYAMDLLHRG